MESQLKMARALRVARGGAEAFVRGKAPPPEGPLVVQPENIPARLKQHPAWVLWRYEANDKGHWSKPAYQPDGQPADADLPRTWSSFDACLEAYLRSRSGSEPIVAPARQFDGIGFELGAEGVTWGIVGVDIDHYSEHAVEADRIVRMLDSYSEWTPGRDGLRVFVLGALPEGRRKRWGVEMYQRSRYLTVTGCRLQDRPPDLRRCDRSLYAVWLQYVHKDDVPDRKVRR